MAHGSSLPRSASEPELPKVSFQYAGCCLLNVIIAAHNWHFKSIPVLRPVDAEFAINPYNTICLCHFTCDVISMLQMARLRSRIAVLQSSLGRSRVHVIF